MSKHRSSTDRCPSCSRCDRNAVVLYTSPDRTSYHAYCSAHFLALDHVPGGAICSRIRPTRRAG